MAKAGVDELKPSFRAKSRLQRSRERFRGEARLSIPSRNLKAIPRDPSTPVCCAQDDSEDQPGASSFSFVNHQFVAVEVAELRHPAHRCLGLFKIEFHAVVL